MREILFRGKRTDNGEWVYGSYLRRTNPCIECFEFAEDGVPEPYIFEVSPETVGQYSELTGKNGVKIFDGDILRVNTGFDLPLYYLFEVKYGAFGGVKNVECHVGYVGFYLVGADKRTREIPRLRNDLVYWANHDDCKIIGNIHDNPELLNQSGS